MKNATAFVLVLLVMLFAYPAMAQYYVGAMGGLNISNIHVDEPEEEFNNLTRYGFGAVLGLNLNKHFSLHLEPMYVLGGTQQDGFEPGLGRFDGKIKTAALSLPVLLKLDIALDGVPFRPYFMAGPTFGYTLDTEIVIETELVDFKGDATDSIERFEFGLGFGGGLSIPVGKLSFFAEGCYFYGLSNVSKGGTVPLEGNGLVINAEIDDEKATTRNFQIMAGVTFPLGR